MSLLSQLVPQHGGSVLTFRVTGADFPVMPPATPLDAANPNAPDRGRSVDDAKDLMRALLADGSDRSTLARLEAAVDERVDVWTPALHTTSRFELVSSLARIDDAITDVSVTISDAIGSGSTVVLLWIASGRFSRPAFFDDDHLVEPSGAVVRVAGTTSVSFTSDHRAVRIRCFYDRLGILEQILAPRSAGICR